MTTGLETVRWDEAHAAGKYAGEPPLPFVSTILKNLTDEERQGHGLYIGCGDGRNYIPLAEAGLNLTGIDISSVAIERLRERYGSANGSVMVRDLDRLNQSGVWNYVIAIQVLQHGDAAQAHDRFARTAMMVKPGGKLFLRVNAWDTEITRDHEVIEGSARGGKTVLYHEGEKQGMKVHFFTKKELGRLASSNGFVVVKRPHKAVEHRQPPATGSWTQWETVWQKRA